MKLKRSKDIRQNYRTEIIVIIFLAIADVAAIFGLRVFTSLTGSERLIIELFITFVILVVSAFLVINKSILLLGKGSEPYSTDRFNDCKGAIRRLAVQERHDYEGFMDSIVCEEGRYAVDKRMMYPELSKFAKSMSREDGDEIHAVSSIEISKFQLDPFAKDYLELNADCVARGVPVKRIFLLAESDLDNRDVIDTIVTHGKRLSEVGKAAKKGRVKETSTGVRWIRKRHLSPEEKNQDLAIFDKCIVARQLVDEYEVTFNDERELQKAETTFQLFWSHTYCEDYTVLADRLKERSSKK